ncbi:MAG: hypothetical protein CV089_02285 [Nitrospira sp. WS110]|nr:hypothetical protein [Nitrospira sp. WS110]
MTTLGPTDEFHPFKYSGNIPPGITGLNRVYEMWDPTHTFYVVGYSTVAPAKGTAGFEIPNGKPDILCYHLAHGKEGNFAVWPTFLEIDKDLDGVFDAVYIDVKGEGRFADLKLYKDLTAPTMTPDHFGATSPKYRPFGSGDA